MRWISYIPLICVVQLILGLTFQKGDASKALSKNAQQVVVGIVETGNGSTEKTQTSWLNDYCNFRKVGHFGEYLFLGLTAVLAFVKKDKKMKSTVKSLIFCAAFSLLDQTIKGFLHGREFDLSDIPFDWVGFCIGIAIAVLDIRSFFRLIEKKERA